MRQKAYLKLIAYEGGKYEGFAYGATASSFMIGDAPSLRLSSGAARHRCTASTAPLFHNKKKITVTSLAAMAS